MGPRSARRCCLFFLACALSLFASAQTLRFDFKLPKSEPAEYHLTLSPAGEASFVEPATDSTEEYRSEFRVSAERAAEAFSTAKSLDYFQGEFDYKKHKLANLGEKRLSYEENGRTTTATFNYSENPTLRLLAEWFQAIAVTQEFARKASFDRRFDKLALDADVKAFVENVKSGRATQVQSIRPLLEELANDPAVLKTVRQRIRDLLAGEPGTANSP